MLDRGSLLLSFLTVAALSGPVLACSKTEGQSAAATAAPGPSAPTTASAAAAPDAAPLAADTTTGTTPAAGTGDAAAPALAASGAAAAPKASAAAGADSALSVANAACGSKPQPDCPLQGWMKANTNPAIAANDLPSLALALEKTVSFAPAGYTNWASISKDGAKAARAGDMTAAKASCRTCHDQYKAKYKAELRGRKL